MCNGGVKYTKEIFINKSKKTHGNKYDYSKVEYNGIFKKVCIICPKHGEFWQTPHSHLHGSGCPKCSHEKIQDITKQCSNEFIEKSQKIHGNKYDYFKVAYKNAITKVCIICPKHGEFWQTPNKHLNGQGCPKCKESSLEEKIRVCLEQHNINYQQEKCFTHYNRRFDFYLPDYKTVIECQGIQHFEEINFFSKNTLKETIQHDKEKFLWCQTNDIKIIYFTNMNFKEKIPFENGYYLKDNIFFNPKDIIANL